MTDNISSYKAVTESSFGEHLWNVIVTLLIHPEIRVRLRSGRVPPPFRLGSAQVIFSGARHPKILLNEEVTGVAQVRLKSGISKRSGEPIMSDEVLGIDGLDPGNDAEHVTAFLLNGVWHIVYRFSYDKALAEEHLRRGTQFLEAAELSLERRHLEVSVFNLWVAAERLAKAALLVIPPSQGLLEGESHPSLAHKYSTLVNLAEYADVLNSLNREYKKAGYLTDQLEMTENEIGEAIRKVRAMVVETRTLIP